MYQQILICSFNFFPVMFEHFPQWHNKKLHHQILQTIFYVESHQKFYSLSKVEAIVRKDGEFQKALYYYIRVVW